MIACEPAEVEELGLGLSEPVERRSSARSTLVLETVGELRAERDPERGVAAVHELSLSGAVVNTVVKHADGRRVSVVSLRVGRLRQVVPDTLEFYFEFVARGTVCEGARLEQEIVEARLRCDACEREWEIEIPAFRCPTLRRRARSRSSRGNEFEVESIEVEEEARMHRTKVRIVEDALDANNTIAQRQPRGLRPRRRDGRQLHERARAPARRRCSSGCVAEPRRASASACSRATCRARWTPTGSPACTCPVTQLNTDPSFGGECHLDANMVRSALPALPLDEIDLLVIENVGNLVCPAEFRVGEDVRVMVSSVTEGEDKPLKYPLMFRTCELVLVNKIDLLPHLDFDLDRFLYNLDQVHPGVERMLVSARTGEGIEAWREWLARGRRARAGALA